MLYILGIVVAFFSIMWFEKKYVVNGDLAKLSKKEWIQDILLSLLSWISVGLVIIVAKMQAKKNNQ